MLLVHFVAGKWSNYGIPFGRLFCQIDLTYLPVHIAKLQSWQFYLAILPSGLFNFFFYARSLCPNFCPHIFRLPHDYFFFSWLDGSLSLRGAPFLSPAICKSDCPWFFFFHRLLRAAPLSFFLPSFSLFLFSFWLDGSLKLERSPFQNFTQLTCGIYLQITKLDQTIFSKYVKGCKVCL